MSESKCYGDNWLPGLPPEFEGAIIVPLCLTTPPVISEHLVRLLDGRYRQLSWDSLRSLYQWKEVNEGFAAQLAEPLRENRDLAHWTELFNSGRVLRIATLSNVNGVGWVRTESHDKTHLRTELAAVEPTWTTKPVATIGFLGGAELANALGVHPSRREAFNKRLERARQKLGDGWWREVSNPRPNSPKFLYQAESPVVRTLAAKHTQSESA